MIHSRKIRYFLAAANHLHFTDAAAELHISQPALSRGIRQLEKRLGMPLFERTAKGVLLTPYGELLARRVRLRTTTSFGGAPHGVVTRRRQSPEASVSAFVSLLKERFGSEKRTLASRPMHAVPLT